MMKTLFFIIPGCTRHSGTMALNIFQPETRMNSLKTTEKKKKKRKVELVVISDVHLGTYGCHAKELVKYMRSIKPKMVVLNGDIIDMWQFSKRYWPKSHMQVIHQITKWMSKGVKIQYITGNHDEMLRKF